MITNLVETTRSSEDCNTRPAAGAFMKKGPLAVRAYERSTGNRVRLKAGEYRIVTSRKTSPKLENARQ